MSNREQCWIALDFPGNNSVHRQAARFE